ncbi:Lysophospholipase L1 [Salibacterium halotolerans]|uniref:Lysophospholipase L1 n=2 Tax=Salibacterium halotolerans TaxID=1884432 RepID=A0A1I5VA43_9BACI|nr:Lysophospholipase L1 [Salibacterium halotolerans]
MLMLLGLVFLLMLPSGAWLVGSSLSDSSPDHTLSGAAATSSKTQQEDTTASSGTAASSSEEQRPFEQGVQDAVASVVNETRRLFISSDLHITAVGDSLTKGTGDSSDNGGYVGILEDSLEKSVPDASIQVDNYGKKGNRSDQILERLNNPKISSSINQADIVLLTVGANDIMKIVRSNLTDLTYDDFQEEKDPYKQRLTSIFERIREENEDAVIYLLGLYNPFNMYFSDIPELDRIVTDWNMIGKNVVNEQEQAGFIPIRDLFQYAGPGYYAEDNFHPNQRGYASMADQVLEYIQPDLEEFQNGTDEENSNE